ncbi:MAG: hypothetical protein M3159_01380 [Actinomycetota bacterium]|nr:hypothetical protein [Actinomycetota bacterium]
MCFSPQADIAGGVVAGAIGIDALRHVQLKSERLLAALPLLLGAHEVVEAFVWWGLTDKVSWSVGGTAVWLYVAFAFVALPVLVPMAVMAVEPDPRRRKIMIAFTAVGVAVAVIYLVAIVTRSVGARIDGHTVVYSIHLGQDGAANGLYVLATCGLLLISSHRHIVIFGFVNAAAVAVLLLLASNANISLWCAWAAVTSLVIAGHLRLSHRAHERSSSLPGQLA